MITALDHIVVLVADLAAATRAYETLLARKPAWRGRADGAATVLFTLDNMTVELMAEGAPRGRPAAMASRACVSGSMISQKCITGCHDWPCNPTRSSLAAARTR
jgi:hypothetical protein